MHPVSAVRGKVGRMFHQRVQHSRGGRLRLYKVSTGAPLMIGTDELLRELDGWPHTIVVAGRDLEVVDTFGPAAEGTEAPAAPVEGARHG